MIGGIGMGEMILIFLVVLLLFGAKRLPEIGSSLGKGIREFKGSIRDIEKEIHVDRPRYTPPPQPTPEPWRIQATGEPADETATRAQTPAAAPDPPSPKS